MSNFEKRTTTLILTKAEAIALFKRLRSKGRVLFYVGINTELPIHEKPGRVFPGYTSLNISITDAIKVVNGLHGDILEGRGARLRIQVTTPEEGDAYNVTNVWI